MPKKPSRDAGRAAPRGPSPPGCSTTKKRLFRGTAPLQPLPAGPLARLTFATPIVQLRLAGTGTLYALRLPSGGKNAVPVSTITPTIRYAPEALPLPPSVLSIANLQEPLSTLTRPIDESTTVQPSRDQRDAVLLSPGRG